MAVGFQPSPLLVGGFALGVLPYRKRPVPGSLDRVRVVEEG